MSRPWMPLYVADYLADTMHLSTLEHGAYMLLIMHYWQSGGLPTDHTKLARIARLGSREWAEIKGTISDLFDKGWTHKRIDAELAQANSKYERRAEAGRKGGLVKRKAENTEALNEANDPENGAFALSQTQALLKQNDVNAKAYAGDAGGNSQPQPQQEKKDNPEAAQPTTPVALAVLLDDLEIRCREAAGLERDPSPGLLVIGPIMDLLDAGWSLDRHILPALRSAKAAGRRGKKWTYYVPIITEGASKPPRHAPPPSDRPAEPKREMPEHLLVAQAVQFIEGQFWPFQSPGPGEPGTKITPEIIAKAKAQIDERIRRRAEEGEAA